MTQSLRFCQLSVLALGLAAGFMSLPRAVAEDTTSLRFTKTVQAIRRAEPAVVNIEGNKPASTLNGAADGPQVNGMGAGVIIDPRGYILTNQHVIQDVSRIEVTLNSGRKYVGKLIARHPETDLAMIKIDSRQDLPVIECGTSSDLMRGEPVIAIGNPFGYHHTVTEGIISALHRDIPVNGVQDYPDLIQTDASINPGNSGGPLLNADGEMIGINAAVRIGAQGIGFAIPVDRALDVAADMIAEYRRNASLAGLRVQTRFTDGESVLTVVSSGTGAIQAGDQITRIDGRPVENRLQYELALIGQRNGMSIPVETRRDGQPASVSLALGTAGSSRVQFASTGSVQERALQKLGVKLGPANPSQVRRVDSSYNGGLLVKSVEKNSPADAALIQAGDILVGLLDWQTPNWDDLEWILDSPEMRTAANPKFHIIRGNDVFWGNLDLDSASIR